MIFYFLYYFSSFHFIFIHSPFHFFFSFFFFLLFSSTQVSSPPSFIFFFTLRTFQQLICFTSERERERERERAAHLPVEIEVAERTSQWRSAFTTQHYHVRRPTTTHPPPHHLGQIGVLFLFFFLIFACSDSTLF